MNTVEKIVSFLSSKGYTITTAESCTSGLIAAKITEVPGSSSVFGGGFVTYSEEMKHKLLGVPRKVLQESGVYSFETVEYMAKRALEITGANISVAVSGIAGPDGGTEKDPVGTVYFCLCFKDVISDVKDVTGVLLSRRWFAGGREQVRQAAADFVFGELAQELGL